MKFRFLLVLLSVFITFFIGCKKDNSVSINHLHGKWSIINIVEREYKDGVIDNQDVDADFSTGDYLVFREDGRFESFEGGSLTGKANYNYNVNSKLITLYSDYQEGEERYTVVSLTSNTLILFEESYSIVQEGIEYTGTREITLNK